MDDFSKTVAWVAVDWGTSNLRIWLMSKDDQPLKKLTSDRGMSVLQPDEFEVELLSLLEPYLSDNRQMPIFCCGMVGSRQGWAEAKYLVTPCSPPSQVDATSVETNDSRIAVAILPGIKQLMPADVMRGEETQIAGFLNQNTDFDGVICLPGTHTKWVQIKAGKIDNFLTFMTGEIFSLLSTKSVLRHGLHTKGWDQSAFDAAVTESMAKPELVAAKLFALRANHLIGEQSPETGLSRLSGLLIGMELAATMALWQNGNVIFIGPDNIAEIYQSSLFGFEVNSVIADVTTMTLSGLSLARQPTKEDA